MSLPKNNLFVMWQYAALLFYFYKHNTVNNNRELLDKLLIISPFNFILYFKQKGLSMSVEAFTLSQMHIEAARNSTDDFNLFHDKFRWNTIKSNPFGSPIALGFQLECFLEHQINQYRENSNEITYIKQHDLNFSSYEISFIGVVKSGDTLSTVIKKSKIEDTTDNHILSNRIVLKSNNKLVMMGYKRDSQNPVICQFDNLPDLTGINEHPDRCMYKNTEFFIKRKFMIVGNAKNFLTSSFAEQSNYIDEFIDKVTFPEIFPISLLSSALLERAQYTDYDLLNNPLVYTSHKLSIDKRLLLQLKSNDKIHILVDKAKADDETHKLVHQCFGIIEGGQVLFTAEIELIPLSYLLSAS